MDERSGSPLREKRILVTRPAREGEDLARRLEALGARVDLRPTIAIEPPLDPGPARAALRALDAYDLLVFTSGNGARFFADLGRDAGGVPRVPRARVAAVGEATARALAELGIVPGLVARDSRAEGMAAALVQEGVSGRRILLVQPERARPALSEALRGAGARVDAVVFYRTEAAPDVAATASRVASGRYDGIVFTSPSSLEHLLRTGIGGVASGLEAVRRIAIGPTTAEALRRASVPAHAVAVSPTDGAIALAVVEAFARASAREACVTMPPLCASRRRRRSRSPRGGPR